MRLSIEPRRLPGVRSQEVRSKVRNAPALMLEIRSGAPPKTCRVVIRAVYRYSGQLVALLPSRQKTPENARSLSGRG